MKIFAIDKALRDNLVYICRSSGHYEPYIRIESNLFEKSGKRVAPERSSVSLVESINDKKRDPISCTSIPLKLCKKVIKCPRQSKNRGDILFGRSRSVKPAP